MIHHSLIAMLDAPAAKQARYRLTYARYQQCFPPAPIITVWPAPTDCSNSTSATQYSLKRKHQAPQNQSPATSQTSLATAACVPVVSSSPAEYVHLDVMDQAAEITTFKLRRTTHLGKLFKAYAHRKGVQKGALRFNLDGQRLDDGDTPARLELEDGDQIDVMLIQSGC